MAIWGRERGDGEKKEEGERENGKNEWELAIHKVLTSIALAVTRDEGLDVAGVGFDLGEVAVVAIDKDEEMAGL